MGRRQTYVSWGQYESATIASIPRGSNSFYTVVFGTSASSSSRCASEFLVTSWRLSSSQISRLEAGAAIFVPAKNGEDAYVHAAFVRFSRGNQCLDVRRSCLQGDHARVHKKMNERSSSAKGNGDSLSTHDIESIPLNDVRLPVATAAIHGGIACTGLARLIFEVIINRNDFAYVLR